MRQAPIALPAAVLLLAGCATPAPSAPAPPRSAPAAAQSPARAFSAWYSAGGHRALTALIAALGAAGSASPADVPAMSAACTRVSTAVTGMEAAGPVPAAAVERWLARALADYSAAASDCQAGLQGDAAGLVGKAGGEINAGTADLARATAAIRRLG